MVGRSGEVERKETVEGFGTGVDRRHRVRVRERIRGRPWTVAHLVPLRVFALLPPYLQGRVSDDLLMSRPLVQVEPPLRSRSSPGSRHRGRVEDGSGTG